MVDHTNFYENLKEAEMRLLHTVVLYDEDPYYVIAICDHKADGVFRVYLDPLGQDTGLAINNYSVPYEWYQETPDGPTRGDKMDLFLDKHKNCGILRKKMNSPLFKKFRPFPLGMCNHDAKAIYIERQPVRQTFQGLNQNMLYSVPVGFPVAGLKSSSRVVGLCDMPVYNTIKGIYPSIEDCVKNLLDPDVINESAAFDRQFALLKGPLDILFLVYKTEVIGYLVDNKPDTVKLGNSYHYTKEVVEALTLFKNIQM